MLEDSLVLLALAFCIVYIQRYVQAARSHGYAVKIIEVDCPNLDVAKVLHP